MPVFFKQLSGILISKFVSCRDLDVSTACTAIAIVETLLELIRLQYPLELVRALARSIPRSKPVVLARRVIRLHIATGKSGGVQLF